VADERREFARAYEHCFFAITLKKSGGKRAAILVGDGGQQFTLQVISKAYKHTTANWSWEDVQKDAVPIVPSSGYFNVAINDPLGPWTCALLVKFDPARQYRKGLGYDQRCVHVALGSPHFGARWFEMAQGVDGYFENRVLADHLAEGHTRNLVSVRQAAEMVESGSHHSVAFSRHFALTLRPNLAKPAVMAGGSVIGCYADGAVWVLDKYLHFRDFFHKKWGIELCDISDYRKR
jgi:hypothetical protein